MENTKKRPNAYAKLFSFFKSKAVRNLVSAILLVVSLFTMLIIDKGNYIREDFFPFLENQKITDFFNFFKIQKFDVKFTAWIIFAAFFIAAFVLLIGNIFSGAVVRSMVSRYGKKNSENKALKVFFGIVYNVLLLLVAAVVIYIFFTVGNVKSFTADNSGVFLNLLYTLLIVLAVVILIFLAIIIAYTVLLLAFAILGYIVYEVAYFAKALDTDGSVFGSKDVQIVPVVVADNKCDEKTEEITEEVVEDKAEETVEEAVIEEPAEEEAAADKAVTEEVVEEAVVEEAAEETKEEAVTEAPVEEKTEEVANKAAVEEIIDDDAEESEENADDFKFSGNSTRLKTSFLCRLIQAEKETSDYYSKLKNHILSFKGVNSRISWNCDSFNKGRSLCSKLNIRGKTVIMYIALDPKDYSVSKYHHVDVSDKSKYAKTPMMLRIRSDRALKYATELITIWMEKNGVKQTEVKDIDYSLPYETNDVLLSRGLIKRV